MCYIDVALWKNWNQNPQYLLNSEMNLKILKILFPPGIEPGTICVLGRCDNHYTTETKVWGRLKKVSKKEMRSHKITKSKQKGVDHAFAPHKCKCMGHHTIRELDTTAKSDLALYHASTEQQNL